MTDTVINSYAGFSNDKSLPTQSWGEIALEQAIIAESKTEEYTAFEKLMLGKFGFFTFVFFASITISSVINAIINSPAGGCSL